MEVHLADSTKWKYDFAEKNVAPHRGGVRERVSNPADTRTNGP